MQRQSVLILTILILLFSGSAFAQFEEYNHPELEWKTIETPHFFVHYHEGIDRTPKLIARIAEEIYGPITQLYRYEPDKKIHFIVKDYNDYSNGAAYYYDNKIEIWATPLDFLLRGSSNWLRNVVTHEFTHMIQLQTSMKMPKNIPAVYFQQFAYEDEKREDVLYGFPNRVISYPIAGVVMPMWLAEGSAQHGASSRGYDSWDSHRDMILRSHALDKGLFSLEQMGVFGKSSIGNESVYNHGFSFVLYLTERFGDDILKKLSRNMSSPFAFNVGRAIKKATGIDAKELHGEWKQQVEQSYLRKTDTIRNNLRQGSFFKQRGSSNIYPAFSPDGKRIAYLSNNRSDYLSYTSLYVQEVGSEKRKKLKGSVVTPPSWDGDGRYITYSKLEKNSENSFYYDIFIYDYDTGNEKRLTTSLRATYPVFSPDGNSIYYVGSGDGIHELFVLDIESGITGKITGFGAGKEIFNSSVSPDGSQIAVSVSNGFGRDIAFINRDGSGFRYILNSKADERDPSFSPDGTKLYYSSDETGIYNIYEYNISDGSTGPLTNVLGGAFMPAVNDEGMLVYSLYSNNGYKLSLIEDLSKVDPGIMIYDPDFTDKIPNILYDDSRPPELESKKYEFQYMTTFFLPRISFDYGKPKLGFYSFSSDALDKYSIFLGGAINRDFDRDLFVLFDYKVFKPTLFLELYNMTRHTSYSFEGDENYRSENGDITLGYWEVDIGARQKITERQNAEFRTAYGRQSANIKPNIPDYLVKPLRYDYYKGLNFNLKWNYKIILPRRDMEINPSYGLDITAEYWRNYDEIFEEFSIEAEHNAIQEVYKKYSYNKLVFDGKAYVGVPFIHSRSALTFRLQGGYIDKPVDDFLYFFAGGLTGIKAYSFYSLEGRNIAVGSVTYRFPLKQQIDLELGPLYMDKLYASIGFQAGDAWSTGGLSSDRLKKGIDLGLRLDLFSFYTYPTRVGFNAAYGFDEFPVYNISRQPVEFIRNEGKSWKFFLTVLFGYDL